MKIQIEEIHFSKSSKKSIVSFIGDIGKINVNENSYMIPKGNYNIEITLENLIDFTNKHEVTIEISNGKILIF